MIDLDVDGGVADLDRSVQITDNFWQTRGLRGWGYMAAGRAMDAAVELRAALNLNRWYTPRWPVRWHVEESRKRPRI